MKGLVVTWLILIFISIVVTCAIILEGVRL